MPAIEDNLLNKFISIVGADHALLEEHDKHPFLLEGRGRYVSKSPVVLRPASVEQVSTILKLATRTSTPIVPQGGNTGLVGAGVPQKDTDNEIMLSLGRMNKILDVDTQSNTILVEAGTVLQTIQQAADKADRLFPLSLGSQGSCQIGGNIGSNAGGTGVLAYGNTRELIMGLEVVLPTGEVWNGLSRLRKDNTGYDLKNLFVGAEGTLGVVTKAVLKLFPKPRGRSVAYCALQTTEQALELLNRARDHAASQLTGFELINAEIHEMTLKNQPGRVGTPVGTKAPWYVLMEVSSSRSQQDADETAEAILGEAFETGQITDASLASSVAQQDALWQFRENMSPAQKAEGASIKHDVSVPIISIPSFIEAADKAINSIEPTARIVNFGHMGDGNLHYNITQPSGWEADRFFELEPKIHEAINDLVLSFEGSISAEHGIGQMKRDKLALIKDPVALAIMHRIKAELDPAGIMNPGKVLQTNPRR